MEKRNTDSKKVAIEINTDSRRPIQSNTIGMEKIEKKKI